MFSHKLYMYLALFPKALGFRGGNLLCSVGIWENSAS